MTGNLEDETEQADIIFLVVLPSKKMSLFHAKLQVTSSTRPVFSSFPSPVVHKQPLCALSGSKLGMASS